MFKKILKVFGRDLKTASRDSMALLIIVMPIVMAIAITLFTPGLNDTTVNLAMLQSDDSAHIKYMQQYSKVELFDSVSNIEERVAKRDDIAGIVPSGDSYEIIIQGNESEVVEGYTMFFAHFMI